jgi:hypothetical protein
LWLIINYCLIIKLHLRNHITKQNVVPVKLLQVEAVCGVLEDVPYAVKQVGAFVVPGAEQLHLIQRFSHTGAGCVI